MEMQSKTNSTIYENVEKDEPEIEMTEDPNSVHTYEVFKPLSVEQNEGIYEDVEKEIAMSEDPDSMNAYESHSLGESDAIYENPFTVVTKSEISNPASTFKQTTQENPYVLDANTENTSSTTT